MCQVCFVFIVEHCPLNKMDTIFIKSVMAGCKGGSQASLLAVVIHLEKEWVGRVILFT